MDSLTLEYVYALLIIFAGGVIRGFTGFASGLVMVPLLALLWGPVEAIASVVGLGIFASIQITIPAIPLVSWRDVRPMIVAGLCFTPVGTVLLITLDPEIVKKIIAAAVILVTVVSLMGWTYKGPRGFIPGFITGA
ncbi:MAG: sulfite exporter TauE/SafE family protein, partial [Rhodospirillales bacterium]|nr:sulfite exporter TauE/SafE family protein [Rhodospirillales bacterium]